MNSSADESNKLDIAALGVTSECDRIDLQEFLDFLILAYRINDALTLGKGKQLHDTCINWTELSRNNLFLRLSDKKPDITAEGETVQTTMRGTSIERVQCILKHKLKDIMNEGILDSVLPFIVKKTLTTNVLKTLESFGSKTSSNPSNKEKMCSKPKCNAIDNSSGSRSNKGDTEIEINVCDAVQKLKKVFRCPKRLLISKMGYFSEVTKGQRLEDIDISVHCEIPIFDWLIKWVKKDLKPKNEWPLLDNGNVVPILVSASFLQMEPLFQECLLFCKNNIDDVLSSSASFGCVNDGVITRLSNQFNNRDVENMVDVKDKLKSRLFTKLIWDLCKRDPKRELGHYGTLAYAYYCSRCNTILVPSVAGRIPCRPPTFKIAQNGSVIACHLRDSKWTLNDHVKSLFSKYKCWRIVYWSLWSECHFMRCSRCQHMYPVKNQRWCQFHTQQPQYYPVENNRYLYYPIGRYPCCNEKTFKYEPIKNPFGCHYREHIPLLEHTAEIETHKVMQMFPSLTITDPPMFFSNGISKLMDAHGDVKSNDQNTTAWPTESHRFAPFIASNEGTSRKSQVWWDNIVMGTSSNKKLLLTELWDKPFAKRPVSPITSDNNVYEATEVPLNEINSSFGSSFEEVEDSLSSFSDSDSAHSERTNYNNRQQKIKRSSKAIRTLKQRYRYSGTYQWSLTAPMRCNQDNQREYEERCFRQIVHQLLHQNSNSNVECSRVLTTTNNPITDISQRSGGYYVRLETELLSKIDPKNAQRPTSTLETKGVQSKTKLKKTPKPPNS
ncbi:hypothetical protein QTP88_005239 [Uroleucon formosanum]